MVGMIWRKTVGRQGGGDEDNLLSGKEKKCEQQTYDVLQERSWKRGRGEKGTGQLEPIQSGTCPS